MHFIIDTDISRLFLILFPSTLYNDTSQAGRLYVDVKRKFPQDGITVPIMNLLYNTYASGSDNSWAISGAYGNVNGQPGRSNRGTYYGGEAMQHTNSGMSDYSNHSDYSNISHGSSSSHGTSTTQNTSCGSWDSQWPPALTAGAEYPGAEIDHGFAQLKFENITEVEPVPFEPPRDTPSSLGWSLDTEYLGHYKLVYHKASPSYLCLELLPEWEISPKTPKIVYLDVHL